MTMALAITMIPKRDREITTCFKCGKTVDLRGGGLYFYDITWKRPRPVCPWCLKSKSPQLTLMAALYAERACEFNRKNPDEAENLALIQLLDVI